MAASTMVADRVETDRRAVDRVGGVSGIALGLAYVLVTVLYSIAGPLEGDDAAAWLDELGTKAGLWWGILGLSVLTDLLFFPLLFALWLRLRATDPLMLLGGVGLVGLFAVLDLAVTWASYAAVLTLGGHAGASDPVQRAADLAAATYAVAVLRSPYFAAYAILLPGLGILLIGRVMLEAGFDRAAGVVGVVTGALAVVAVVGPIVWSPLGVVVILTSVLTTVWVLLAGIRLLRPGAAVSATG
jgi:hypothetical protein